MSDDVAAETTPSSGETHLQLISYQLIMQPEIKYVRSGFWDYATEIIVNKQSGHSIVGPSRTYNNAEIEYSQETATYNSKAPTQNGSRIKIRAESWTTIVRENNLTDMKTGK